MTRSIPKSFVIGLAISWSLLHVLLGVSSLELSSHPYASVAAIFVCLSLMALVLFPPGGQIPPAMTPVLMVGIVLVTGLVVWGLPLDVWPGYAAWFQGSLECLLITIAVRRRPRTALLGCAVLAVLVLGWSTRTVAGIGQGLTLVVAPVLLTLIAVGLARFLALNDARADAQLQQAIELVDQATVADTRRAEALAWARDVGEVAGPSLRLAASPDVELSEGERAEMVCVAASLRDRIRGGSLATPALLAAAAEAREHGVAVSLLDDRGEALPPLAVDRLTDALVEVLPRLRGGTLTIRTRPVSTSPPVATIAYMPGDPSAEAEYLTI